MAYDNQVNETTQFMDTVAMAVLPAIIAEEKQHDTVDKRVKMAYKYASAVIQHRIDAAEKHIQQHGFRPCL